MDWRKDFDKKFCGKEPKEPFMEVICAGDNCFTRLSEDGESFIENLLEQERKRISDEIEKSMEGPSGGDSFEVEARLFRNTGRREALSIINKK